MPATFRVYDDMVFLIMPGPTMTCVQYRSWLRDERSLFKPPIPLTNGPKRTLQERASSLPLRKRRVLSVLSSMVIKVKFRKPPALLQARETGIPVDRSRRLRLAFLEQ